MAFQAPPKSKISLFNDVDIRGNYVGVLRPIREEESELELPEGTQQEEGLSEAPARVARVGPDVDNLEVGDKAIASMFMQQPHNVIEREDDNGELFHMFIIDSDMIVATLYDQKESVEKAL